MAEGKRVHIVDDEEEVCGRRPSSSGCRASNAAAGLPEAHSFPGPMPRAKVA